MSNDMRTALIAGGLIFVLGFAGMTLVVAAESGFTVLTAAAILIIVLLLLPLIGALRHPPDE